ncbi:hypothetical protein DFJ58DRAFT_841551 [Suillus subalutaceus]|uniref:uncharacterized protein n=1 Tax=Suillus subalutaceus TaxID=48586 RepID=UPI001B86F676|nr:uncharacterized protein DFJ58DRAFT_841551 [Suillus subalutaceus]KAG1853699.1 hypothetical protein DFJ58DRAFT_841551 [Suillus subalutaceus]
MVSNVRHPPALLDRTKNQDRMWSNAIQDTINRTAGTVQTMSPPTPDELWAERSRSATFNPPADPYTGRRVFVNGDLGEAFRRLQTRLRRNRVMQEVSRQRRHEKKGVKRRRLSSERWRRMFANEVRKKVQLAEADVRYNQSDSPRDEPPSTSPFQLGGILAAMYSCPTSPVAGHEAAPSDLMAAMTSD